MQDINQMSSMNVFQDIGEINDKIETASEEFELLTHCYSVRITL